MTNQFLDKSGVVELWEAVKKYADNTSSIGISPTVNVEAIDGGHKVTITDKNGENTFEVMDGGFGVEAKGLFGFEVDENGQLLISYVGDEPPAFSLEGGHLYYDVPPRMDLGQVCGDLPEGGNVGQVLVKTEDGVGWADSESSGKISWENINGRPDLSTVSALTIKQITLRKDYWNKEVQQTVVVLNILGDESKQLVIPIPLKENETEYYNYNIKCIGQNDNLLTFSAEIPPERDLIVNIFAINSVETSQEFEGEFVWWSPAMTSDTEPYPYVASSNAIVATNEKYFPYRAFDNIRNSAEELLGVFITNSTGGQGNLQFDFGEQTWISGIRLFHFLPNTITVSAYAALKYSFPKKFIFEGSNDEQTYRTIFEEDGSKYPIITEEEETNGIDREWFFSPVCYRYYRITCIENYYTTNLQRLAIEEMQFYKLEESE